jgi:phosphoglycerate dehydrogenase-like enzyme
MKAVLQFRANPGLRIRLAREAPEWLRVVVVDEADKATFSEQMISADVLLHVLEPVTKAVMDRAPNLRLIQKIGGRVDTIDLDAARARGITVANMPGSNAQAVAEMTLALMLATLRRIPLLDRETRGGRGWHLPLTTFDSVGEIHGRTIGLIGYGEVPRRLAPVLYALGAKMLYTSPTPKAHAIAKWCPLPELLAASDVISLHVPLKDETALLINAKAIARMKRGAVLINTASGGLVDEAALLDALQTGQLTAAGLDTLVSERAGADHPLAALDNVVLTPHAAWLTAETLTRSVQIAIENCRRLLHGESLLYEVLPAR